MMLDEVQTGNGRTGHYFAYQDSKILPDVVTTAKGLGNGYPIGACLTRGKANLILTPGSHGSTFGGNPLGCAAALATIEQIEIQPYHKLGIHKWEALGWEYELHHARENTKEELEEASNILSAYFKKVKIN